MNVNDNDSFMSRTISLIGLDNFNKLKQTHVAVFGIGGVGGSAAEVLIRSGIEHLSIIDHDIVKASNLNRQILFTGQDIGISKVKVAHTRFNLINSHAQINIYSQFITPNNLTIFPFNEFDYVIDAIDSTSSKVALIKYLIDNDIPFISSLGMGNRLDPNKLIITTLDKTHDDPFAKKLRNELKKISVDLSKVPVVTSNEIPLKTQGVVSSMIFTPLSAGLLLANYIVQLILKK